MNKKREKVYKRACVELYEILQNLNSDERKRIPDSFIENVRLNRAEDYSFELDLSKDLKEQDIMPETKALIIQVYENYLMPDSEAEKWKSMTSIVRVSFREKSTNIL